jgi:hypothetical protein
LTAERARWGGWISGTHFASLLRAVEFHAAPVLLLIPTAADSQSIRSTGCWRSCSAGDQPKVCSCNVQPAFLHQILPTSLVRLLPQVRPTLPHAPAISLQPSCSGSAYASTSATVEPEAPPDGSSGACFIGAGTVWKARREAKRMATFIYTLTTDNLNPLSCCCSVASRQPSSGHTVNHTLTDWLSLVCESVS